MDFLVTLSPLSALGALQVTVRDHGYPHVPHYLEVPKMLGYLGGKTPELVSLTVIQGKENRHTDRQCINVRPCLRVVKTDFITVSGAVCPPKLRKIYFRGLPAWTASLFLAGSPNLAELYLDNIYDFPWPNPMAVRKDSPWDDFGNVFSATPSMTHSADHDFHIYQSLQLFRFRRFQTSQRSALQAPLNIV